MNYDLSLLEIDEKTDLSIELVKKAYRRLLKKYHPDLNKNDLAYTEKIIKINEAYQRLIKHLSQGAGTHHHQPTIPKTGNAEGLVQYKDQACGFYKQGFIHFDKIMSNIDPLSGMKLVRTEALIKSREITRQVETDSPEIAALVSKQLYHASRAIYYFSIVRSEYGESEWAYDSHRKIIHIKKYLEKNLIMIKEFLSKRGNKEK